jgi:hypothetical protein
MSDRLRKGETMTDYIHLADKLLALHKPKPKEKP